jgi:hypothetical protein
MRPLQALEALRMETSSSGSLMAKADESAGVISTSSKSFWTSLKAFLHSSAKGPVVVSFGRVPIFFCHVVLAKKKNIFQLEQMTYSCFFDDTETLFECLCLCLGFLSGHQNLDWDLATLQRLQKLGYVSTASV